MDQTYEAFQGVLDTYRREIIDEVKVQEEGHRYIRKENAYPKPDLGRFEVEYQRGGGAR